MCERYGWKIEDVSNLTLVQLQFMCINDIEDPEEKDKQEPTQVNASIGFLYHQLKAKAEAKAKKKD